MSTAGLHSRHGGADAYVVPLATRLLAPFSLVRIFVISKVRPGLNSPSPEGYSNLPARVAATIDLSANALCSR